MSRLTADQRQRLEHQLALLERARSVVPSGGLFGQMRLRTERREIDVVLAQASGVAEGISVIDWRTAPLAELFFTCDVGEPYELDLGDRLVQGTLLDKALWTLHHGALVRIESGSELFSRSPEGEWLAASAVRRPLAVRPPESRRPFRSPLEVELDPAQRRVVELPPHRSVLLLGEAGFGKTTVALHRLVALRARAGRGFSSAVLVPTEGLRRLTELMLERRGVRDIDVHTFDEWARALARRVFRFLPRRESVNTPSSVIRLKRHRALREVLPQFVRAHPRPAREEGRSTESKGRASRADLETLFGDAGYLQQVVARAEGSLYPAAVQEVIAHTKVQFSDPAEMTYAHVRADQLATVDGRKLDEGTPMEDANSVDAEDYPVLFELDRLRAQRRGAAPLALGRYDCIVVDEAQEFSPLELALIGRTLRSRGTLIVAGDAAQRVDPTASFGGWEQVLEELGVPHAERATLEVNYRCPPDVTQLARSVVGLIERAPSHQPSVLRAALDSAFHLAVWLSVELTRLEAEDPSASIAVICRTPEAARALFQALRHGTDARLALEGTFDFRPGLVVTCVQEVKGLEFDYVLLPDASAQTYTSTEEARRALYVGITRATHRLTLAASGAFSPILTE